MRISDKDEADTFLSPEIFHHLIPSGRGSQVFMVRRMKVATEVSDIENTCYPIQCLGQAAGRGVQDDDGLWYRSMVAMGAGEKPAKHHRCLLTSTGLSIPGY